jgi:hypothetical protein
MKVDYRDAAGALLGSDKGGSACVADNAHHEFTVALGSFASPDTVRATVRLQTLGSDGEWRNAGSTSQSFSSRVHTSLQLTGGSF